MKNKPSALRSNLKFVALILVLVLCFEIGRFFKFDLDQIKSLLVDQPPALSAILFIALYVFVTFFIWLSKDFFRITAAVLFGPYVSTLLVWSSEMINACILFHLSRKLGRQFVEDKFKLKLKTSDIQISDQHFWKIFLLRIMPLVPFRFLDLGFGLTQVSFRKYFLISFFASPIRIFWLQFIVAGVGEAVLKDPSALMTYIQSNRLVLVCSLLYLLLILVSIFFYKRKSKTNPTLR